MTMNDSFYYVDMHIRNYAALDNIYAYSGANLHQPHQQPKQEYKDISNYDILHTINDLFVQ